MIETSTKYLLSGHVLRFDGDISPDIPAWVDSAGGIVISGGKIIAVGNADQLRRDHPDAAEHAYGDHLIAPGFIDAHAHYPQTAMIASWGKQLIDWLNTYTFPEEARFCDDDYAQMIAKRYLHLTRSAGTTTMASFCTIHPASVDALFSEAQKAGQRIVAGKTCMDRNAPDNLRDTAQSAYDESKALAQKWHNVGRLSYAITPRFSPTSSPEQLAALGALWAEMPDCLMQTHLSEQIPEIAWMRELYPDARDYLDTYEKFGLLGEKGLYGHAIHLEPRERARLREVGAAVVHCPTSNTFIGSGLFDYIGLACEGISIGLATDTGGGSSFSMLRTMAAAYEIAQLRGHALHPARLMWLATAGSAQSLHLGDKIGSLRSGAEADVVVLDLSSTEAIAQRVDHANDIWEKIFATIMMGDERAVHDLWIGGARLA